MAKTTPGKGKNDKKQPENGPVLVAEPPDSPEEQTIIAPVPLEDDSEEEIIEAAEAAPDPRRIPPANNLSSEQLWSFIAQYPVPEELDLYVYRVFPVIRSSPPSGWTGTGRWPTYQEKLKGLVSQQTNRVADYDWLRNVRGSGKYHLRLIDRRLKRTQNRQLCEAIVEIGEWDTHPPVLNDWSELVPCEANNWIIQRLIKDQVIKRNPEGGFVAFAPEATKEQPAASNGDPGAILDKTVNLAERLAKTMAPKTDPSMLSGTNIVELIKTTLQTNDPSKQVSTLKDLLEMTKPPAPLPPEKPDNTIVTLLMGHLEAQRQEQQAIRAEAAREAAAARERESREATASREREFKLLNDLLAKANAPGPDPVQQLTVYAEMAKKMKDAFGPSEKEQEVITQSRMNGMQEFIAEIVKPFAPGVNAMLGSLGQLMNLKAQQAAIQAQQQRAPAAPAAPAPQQRPNTAAVAPAPPPPPPPPDNAPTPPAQDQQPVQERAEVIAPDASMNKAQAEARIIMTVLGSVAATLISYVDNPELTGGDFAAWFADGTFPTGLPYPDMVSGMDALPIVKQYAPDMILNLIKGSAPPLYARLAPTPEKDAAFLQFLTEFLEYDPNAEPSEEEPKA